MTVSRLLELGSFSNAHRVQWHGRDTIVVDYTGDPKAKTRTSFENVIRDLVGTIWVDEQDHAIAKLEGHFVNNFKVGGGLLVNIQKGLTFSMEQVRINDEVWLPAHIEGHGSARALLFFRFNGKMLVEDSNYRKFKTDSTIISAGTSAAIPAPSRSGEALRRTPIKVNAAKTQQGTAEAVPSAKLVVRAMPSRRPAEAEVQLDTLCG